MRRVAVIGAGAAGMTAALALSRPELLAETPFQAAEASPSEVVVFEKAEPLTKLRASGNGRCNFTNAHLSPRHYTGQHADFVTPLLARFGFPEILRWFQLLGMDAVTLESGMTYPVTLRAQTVADVLERHVVDAGATMRRHTPVERVTRMGEAFVVEAEREGGGHMREEFDVVLLTTGGSYGVKKDDYSNGYQLAKQNGHTLTSLHAGIVALRVAERERCQALQGIKLTARASFGAQETTDDVLFTDYGLSGTGALRLSNALLDRETPVLTLDVLPTWEEEALVDVLLSLATRFPRRTPAELLSGYVYAPVVERAARETGVQRVDSSSLCHLVHTLKHWDFHVLGSRKRDHGQVTCGGVAVGDVDALTMASKRTSGLFFAGELLDVQGECGGYNLHWAFTSALAAARAISVWGSSP